MRSTATLAFQLALLMLGSSLCAQPVSFRVLPSGIPKFVIAPPDPNPVITFTIPAPPPPPPRPVIVLGNWEHSFLAAVLVLEAASEGPQGMQAIANVIQNRSRGNQLYRTARHPGTFSSVTRLSTDQAIARARRQTSSFAIARDLIADAARGNLADLTLGATHYDNVRQFGQPTWARDMRCTITIGRHVFFR